MAKTVAIGIQNFGELIQKSYFYLRNLWGYLQSVVHFEFFGYREFYNLLGQYQCKQSGREASLEDTVQSVLCAYYMKIRNGEALWQRKHSSQE